ncbi:unnamed protein product [Thelazia callipaeda]|uniref:Methyltransferase-like protein 5 n=1 Tax=Thelazia callipaeda TaxID=103827 RepID=A0A0N5D9S9_THECL|nr:unnamed protein product [Thelazia callipaeda]
MKKKHLESFLSAIETFQNPKVRLEQYSTGIELAEAILSSIYDEECIDNCAVADLGCGCGILLLGAVKLGARYGVGVEIDEEAIKICRNNLKHCQLENCVDIICLDVTKNITALMPVFDTVIMNPPFGTKNNAGFDFAVNLGIDLQFVEAGFSLLKQGGKLFSLHKSSTRHHIKKFADRKKKRGISGECIAELVWDLPATYVYHKRQSVDIQVDLWRFSVDSEASAT